MAEEALQVAFEIKTACDEISRGLLRWHWEQKPGEHGLDALLRHLEQRRAESPEYYERLPELSGKNSWKQLDTTLCMRVLLDPEKDAARPLDLLGNTARPAAARRACNAVRTARNQAAHASDHADAAQAAILFNEAVESLEAGYEGTALRTGELAKYYRMAEDFLARCGGKKPVAAASAEPEEEAAPPRRSTQSAEKPRAKAAATARKSAPTAQKKPAARSKGRHSATAASRARKKQRQIRVNRAAVTALLVVTMLGLLVRAYTMGLLGF